MKTAFLFLYEMLCAVIRVALLGDKKDAAEVNETTP